MSEEGGGFHPHWGLLGLKEHYTDDKYFHIMYRRIIEYIFNGVIQDKIMVVFIKNSNNFPHTR